MKRLEKGPPSSLSWADTLVGRAGYEFDLFKEPAEGLTVQTGGVYLLVARGYSQAIFWYPLRVSNVFYIGRTSAGQPRLVGHQRWAKIVSKEIKAGHGLTAKWWPRYTYAAAYKARGFWFPVKGRETPSQLEAKLFDDFYWTHGDLPVANNAWATYRKNAPAIDH